MPDPKPFGQKKIVELLNYLDSCSDLEEYEYKLGISILFSWREYYEEHGWTDDSTYNMVKKRIENEKFRMDLCSGRRMISTNKKELDDVDYYKVVHTRHSVRDYQDTEIEESDITYALKCFVETPTACNRQMCRVYYIRDESTKLLLDKTLIGLTGFNLKSVHYFIITYDLAAFEYSGERQQGLLNVGLCTANFINALHVKGIGTCCLQWTNKKAEDSEVRKKLGIRKSERIGIVIGAGYYLEQSIIPCSVRRKPEDVYSVI